LRRDPEPDLHTKPTSRSTSCDSCPSWWSCSVAKFPPSPLLHHEEHEGITETVMSRKDAGRNQTTQNEFFAQPRSSFTACFAVPKIARTEPYVSPNARIRPIGRLQVASSIDIIVGIHAIESSIVKNRSGFGQRQTNTTLSIQPTILTRQITARSLVARNTLIIRL
jgi:hypothetical protein